MKRVRRTAVAAVAVCAGLVAVPQAAAAATTCVATVLPTPAGTTVSDVVGTDGNGTFAGSVIDATQVRHGVVWHDGSVTELDNFIPYDINSAGLIGGYTVDPGNGRAVAALRTADGQVRRLTASYSTWVAGVNDAGDAVGGVILEHPVIFFPAVWHAPDYELEGFFEAFPMAATAIDDTGLAMGQADSDGANDMVWLSAPGNEQVVRQYGPETGVRLYDLDNGVLAATHNRLIVTIDARTGAETVVRGSLNGVPAEINDGVVVGTAWGMAMLWRDGEAVRLPAPAGTAAREANAVNATGTQVGGISVRADGTAVPTLWDCHSMGR
jgi:uncharacterized membrane protein